MLQVDHASVYKAQDIWANTEKEGMKEHPVIRAYEKYCRSTRYDTNK